MSLPTQKNLNNVVTHAGRVGVLMGGASAEREVSIRSGNAIVAALSQRGVAATALDWDGSSAMPLEDNFDRYLIAVHGRGGEDGHIQAALDLASVPYTGSGVLGCALAMDKSRAKMVWIGAGLPTPDFEWIHPTSDVREISQSIGFPLVVKPACEGSSFGISIVRSEDEFGAAVLRAREFDANVIAERFVTGSEYTVGILGAVALPIIRIETPREFYDYDAKYASDDTRYICPCGLPETTQELVSDLALQAFAVLDGAGWGRVDFICDGEGQPWLIELNTVPGMTDHSLVPMAAAHAGLSFGDLVLAVLATSMSADVIQ